MTSGSASWQMIFLALALGLIVLETIRGWRLGLMRQLMRAVAIIAAYCAAIYGGPLFRPLVRPFLKVPDIVISIIVGAILALIVYSVVVTAAAMLFKQTRQQQSRVIRMIYGTCGALLGILFGFFTVWLIVVAIRSLGSVSEASLHMQAAQNPARLPNDTSRGLQANRPQPVPSEQLRLIPSLAKLKNSIELAPIGNVVTSVDPVPAWTYETLGKVGQVVSNPESAERFLSFPGAKELAENPKIIALRDDSEILRMIQEGRLVDLLQNPRIIAAANDPALATQLKGFEIRKALDYAIRKD